MLHNSEKDFIKRHIGPSKKDEKDMLGQLGYQNINELISQTVPEKILFKGELNIGEPNSEYEALRILKGLSRKKAIKNTIMNTGAALMITTTVLVSGFLCLLLSAFLPSFQFGLLSAAMIGTFLYGIASSTFDSRVAIMTITIVILAGTILASRIDLEEGIRVANEEDARNRAAAQGKEVPESTKLTEDQNLYSQIGEMMK